MKKYLVVMTLAFAISFVSGCASIPVTQTKDCFGFKKITPTSEDVDVISSHLGRQILQHDLHGENIGCWNK